ncbi:MAG: NTPase, partial [Desulfobaccales bacterium]
QGPRAPAPSPKPPPPTPYRGLEGEFEGRAGDSLSPGSPLKFPRILLTGPPRCGKTTIIKKVVERFPGKAAGFYTREVREQGERVGFEIVTLDGHAAWLSHVNFPGPQRVGKYGVSLENLHRVALPALDAASGIDLVVVDEIGKMECLSPRLVEAVERLWAAPVALLLTVAAKGDGYIQKVKEKPDRTLITVTPANRDELPGKILQLLGH